MGIRYYHNHLFIEPPLDPVIDSLINRKNVERCPKCGCILFVGDLSSSSCIEIECRKCRTRCVYAVPDEKKK